MCYPFLQIWISEKWKETDCEIPLPIEEYRAKQIMDLIRKPPELKANETLCLVRTSFR